MDIQTNIMAIARRLVLTNASCAKKALVIFCANVKYSHIIWYCIHYTSSHRLRSVQIRHMVSKCHEILPAVALMCLVILDATFLDV